MTQVKIEGKDEMETDSAMERLAVLEVLSLQWPTRWDCPELDQSMLRAIELTKQAREKAMVTFIEKRCAEMGVRELWLTVNKHNSDSIAFYQRMGFTTAESLVQDIGNDFVMDDYRMAKQIAATAPCE
jgi:GNAT superfamily N-acetyltransferase